LGERSSRSPPPRHRPRLSPPRGCGGQNPAVHPLHCPCGSQMCHHPGSSRPFCKVLMWCSLSKSLVDGQVTTIAGYSSLLGFCSASQQTGCPGCGRVWRLNQGRRGLLQDFPKARRGISAAVHQGAVPSKMFPLCQEDLGSRMWMKEAGGEISACSAQFSIPCYVAVLQADITTQVGFSQSQSQNIYFSNIS
jgi:hypothetical protein